MIDDKIANQESARTTLAGHDLTVLGTTVEAGALFSKYSKVKFDFDVVLTDLMMPVDHKGYAGQSTPFGPDGTAVDPASCVGEKPVGLGFALLAAKKGAKFVAVVTGIGHHSDPIVAQFDFFGYGESTIRVEDAKVMLVNGGGTSEHVKDWGAVLEALIKK
ncbi:response regulator [Candidatus Kaiserbacteria bacterium]|nr:response regulator [Candidatus Kaiserbacteria bacterium]